MGTVVEELAIIRVRSKVRALCEWLEAKLLHAVWDLAFVIWWTDVDRCGSFVFFLEGCRIRLPNSFAPAHSRPRTFLSESASL
jgi:hypothetical protein